MWEDMLEEFQKDLQTAAAPKRVPQPGRGEADPMDEELRKEEPLKADSGQVSAAGREFTGSSRQYWKHTEEEGKLCRELLLRIRSRHPLVHCISNIVTANDCANLVLAVGGSPMMAQEAEEMEEIDALASALVLNTGTPDQAKFAACLRAGLTANRRGIPVILDPVGAGAGKWRYGKLKELLAQVHPDIIRVNAGEARALIGMKASEHGVDSLEEEEDAEQIAGELAVLCRCTVLLTGTEDLVTDGKRSRRIGGGSVRMKQITGAGCMLTALTGAFAAVEEDSFTAACEAAAFWKSCAESAERHNRGLGHFHMGLFDAASEASDRAVEI